MLGALLVGSFFSAKKLHAFNCGASTATCIGTTVHLVVVSVMVEGMLIEDRSVWERASRCIKQL